MSAVTTYEAIAPVYDSYTSHYDHEGWIAELLPVLERYGLRQGALLDVGCGTGESFLPMLKRGWEVTACDISPAMLARAAEKAGDAKPELEVADMRDLPRFGSFELVWALGDAVNYLLDRCELEAALRGMRSNLSPEGLLFFDANTLTVYRSFFVETHSVELEDGGEMIWRGDEKAGVEPGAICEATMLNEGEALATHRQRHFPEGEVLEALERAGLECLDVYGQSTDGVPRKPLDEGAHTKAIYIARAAR